MFRNYIIGFFTAGIVLTAAGCTASANEENSNRSTIVASAATTDSLAIMKAIETETRNFYKKDHPAWSNSYVQSPQLFWLCVERGITLRASGWNDLSQFVAEWMKANPVPMIYENLNFVIKNVHITRQGNMAFVTMEGSNLEEDGKTVRNTRGNRTLVKEGNDWKILSMTSYPSDAPAGSTANVYVHQAEK